MVSEGTEKGKAKPTNTDEAHQRIDLGLVAHGGYGCKGEYAARRSLTDFRSGVRIVTVEGFQSARNSQKQVQTFLLVASCACVRDAGRSNLNPMLFPAKPYARLTPTRVSLGG